uniref:Small ribosomal subunit protein uS7 domain-containing protein n=1 Tax=Cucumis sativus TaxID=3659 RepID=A0A0A0LRZ5_CUCSA
MLIELNWIEKNYFFKLVGVSKISRLKISLSSRVPSPFLLIAPHLLSSPSSPRLRLLSPRFVRLLPLLSSDGDLKSGTMAVEVDVVNQELTLPHHDVKLFNRWTFDDVQVNDISLVDYVGVAPAKHATYVPHTAGRYSVKRFRKAQCPIVERLTNSLMMHGRNNGKKLMAVRIIKHAMEIIHLLTDLNTVQVIVDAVVNSGPREDATRIGSAGVVRRQAVDISPLRRVNQAIYLLTTGAREAAFRNIKTIAECLADELINAAKGSSNSYAIKKKDEIERVAKANR